MRIIKKEVNSQYGGLFKKVFIQEKVKENDRELIQETNTTYIAGIPVRSVTETRPWGVKDAILQAWGSAK
ncbi:MULTISPECIES: hypothetical protein [Bacillus]|nr:MULTISPECIES: hypothetical protein [Bacillus]APJ26606.1 hypothetical protein BSZ43_07330 [Bacillus sp. H15-1]ASV14981.1 hypothetical protein CJO35_07385 [Bacillus sp. 1s-1]KAA0815487.1 hypothetical protein EI974_16570 [Bacillus licheniformis]KAA0830954.1 hypothetical protein EI980_12365 [Bacillus licheniformis]KAA0847508.1 hypothetical protein EI975_07340 [Bacillus licheniformis]